MEIRTAYSDKPRVQISFAQTGRTKQAHQKETDINNIMAKYVKSGIIEHSNKHSAEYGFATSADLHEALNTIQKAQTMFDDLPSKARIKFENEPGQFLDFVQDPENEDQLFDLGLSDIPPDEEIRETLPITEAPTEAVEPS